MLGYITTSEQTNSADIVLQDLAAALQAKGVRLAGAVQINTDLGPGCVCDMDLQILGDDGPEVRITQALGSGSKGCRLDTGALELAVARVETVLAQQPDMVILNKFARQEVIGKGFHGLIGTALAQGLPVLICVPDRFLDQFLDYAGEMAVKVTDHNLAEWCEGAMRDAAA